MEESKIKEKVEKLLVKYMDGTNFEDGYISDLYNVKSLRDDIIKLIEENIKEETTTVNFYDFKETEDSFYQCDKCGCLNILSNAEYCPGCGRKIE